MEKYYISKIGIFGSYSSNRQESESDLDILIEFGNDVEDIYIAKKNLRERLTEVTGLEIDLAREKYLKPYYKKQILDQVIYV